MPRFGNGRPIQPSTPASPPITQRSFERLPHFRAWEHAKLSALVAQGSFRRAHLTEERLEANRRRGNRYDDTVSILVPLAAARKCSAGVLRFDVDAVTAEPGYQAFAKQNPNTQREF
jgi:hypothetical protein